MLPAPSRMKVSSLMTEDLLGPYDKPTKTAVPSYGSVNRSDTNSNIPSKARKASVAPPFNMSRTLSVSPKLSSTDGRHDSVLGNLDLKKSPSFQEEVQDEAPLTNLFNDMNVAVMNLVGRDKKFQSDLSREMNMVSLSARSRRSGVGLGLASQKQSKSHEVDPFEELLNSVSKGLRPPNGRIPSLSSDSFSPVKASKKGRGKSFPVREVQKHKMTTKYASDDTHVFRTDQTHFGAPKEVNLRNCVEPLSNDQYIVVDSSEQLLHAMPPGTQASVQLMSRAANASTAKRRRGLIMSNGKTIAFVPNGHGPTIMLDKNTIRHLRIDAFSDRCLVPDAVKTL